jgi:hypothetical protein
MQAGQGLPAPPPAEGMTQRGPMQRRHSQHSSSQGSSGMALRKRRAAVLSVRAAGRSICLTGRGLAAGTHLTWSQCGATTRVTAHCDAGGWQLSIGV